MVVRPAVAIDAPDIVPLMRKFAEETEQAQHHEIQDTILIERLESLLNSEEAIVLVAYTDEGELIGAAAGLLYPVWFCPEERTGSEMFWYVYPEHRKSKAGSRMFRMLEEWAFNEGASSFNMIALANKHAKRVGRMYESKGYLPAENVYKKRFNQ